MPLVMTALPSELNRFLYGNRKLFLAFLIVAVAAIIPVTHAIESNNCENLELAVRWGMGGFRDGRAEDGKLGGDQFALDVARCGSPVSFSLSSEFYTKGPVSEARNSYEISDMYTLNIQYTRPLPGFERTDYILSAGIGRLKVPYLGGKVD